MHACTDLTCNRLNPSGEVVELSGLVTKILQVFENVAALSLKEKWTMIALQVCLPAFLYDYVKHYIHVHAACAVYKRTAERLKAYKELREGM